MPIKDYQEVLTLCAKFNRDTISKYLLSQSITQEQLNNNRCYALQELLKTAPIWQIQQVYDHLHLYGIPANKLAPASEELLPNITHLLKKI